MVTKASPKRKKLNLLLDQIEAVDDKRMELWDRYGNATSYKKEDTIRRKIHPLDLIKMNLFIRLWDAYLDFPDEVEEIGTVRSEVTKQTSDLYCDGAYHFVVNQKTDELRYGYECNCD